MAGTIVADTIQDGAGNSTSMDNAIYGSAKAWVNFNGASGAIRASYNVSSVTRNSTGNYTVNFTTALTDANYSAVFGGQGGSAQTLGYLCGAGNNATVQQTSSALPCFGSNGANSQVDIVVASVAVFR